MIADARLDVRPVSRPAAGASFQDHRGRAVSQAANMQIQAAAVLHLLQQASHQRVHAPGPAAEDRRPRTCAQPVREPLRPLHADRHDAAYDWAERREIGRHSVTGALRIVESAETVREVERVVEILRQPEAPPLFETHDDDYLLSLGVPESWLPALRRIRDEDQLLVVCEKVPEEIAERLLSLAAGEFVTPPEPIASDRPTTEAADTRRRFFVVEDIEELAAARSAHGTMDRFPSPFTEEPGRTNVQAKRGAAVAQLLAARDRIDRDFVRVRGPQLLDPLDVVGRGSERVKPRHSPATAGPSLGGPCRARRAVSESREPAAARRRSGFAYPRKPTP